MKVLHCTAPAECRLYHFRLGKGKGKGPFPKGLLDPL